MDGEAITSENVERGEFGAKGMDGALDFGVKGGLEMLGEAVTGEEMMAKRVDGLGAKGTRGIMKVIRHGGLEEMALEGESEVRIFKTIGWGGARKAI